MTVDTTSHGVGSASFFRKPQEMDDCLYYVGSLGSKAPIPLVPKFKISDAENFDGTCGHNQFSPFKKMKRSLNRVDQDGEKMKSPPRIKSRNHKYNTLT